ncbi:MAG: universal stress protein [Deltaproteobacteria bacterium]|jgi:nucleotide-binding universal stress UspA family protein|nr:universal stress protein [Deltaproteobacteria bacterium]MCW8893655.1 universal stress protein [Deltaproteobacteria bacterium]
MLPLYNNILVTTDFTPNSDNAFKHAVMLARLNDAKIHLLHVLPQVDSSMRSYVSSVLGENRLEEFEHSNMEKARVEMKKNLDEFAKAELDQFPADFARFAGAEVVTGHPVVKILEVADRLNVDVIVMGTHGKGPLEHAFLGSVTEKILRKTSRPVFAIPLTK